MRSMIKNFANFFTKDYDEETKRISQSGSNGIVAIISRPERLPHLQLPSLLKERTLKPGPANELPCRQGTNG